MVQLRDVRNAPRRADIRGIDFDFRSVNYYTRITKVYIAILLVVTHSFSSKIIVTV